MMVVRNGIIIIIKNYRKYQIRFSLNFEADKMLSFSACDSGCSSCITSGSCSSCLSAHYIVGTSLIKECLRKETMPKYNGFIVYTTVRQYASSNI